MMRPRRVLPLIFIVAIGACATWGGRYGRMNEKRLCAEVAGALERDGGDPHMPVNAGRQMPVRRAYAIMCDDHQETCTETDPDACLAHTGCEARFTEVGCAVPGAPCAYDEPSYLGCEPETGEQQRLRLVHWLHCRSGQKGPPPCY